jgi:hypothetical protein
LGACPDRQWVGFACQGGERCCHFGEACADVGGHGPAAAAVVLMSCISLRDGEAEVLFDPGEGRVAYNDV